MAQFTVSEQFENKLPFKRIVFTTDAQLYPPHHPFLPGRWRWQIYFREWHTVWREDGRKRLSLEVVGKKHRGKEASTTATSEKE